MIAEEFFVYCLIASNGNSYIGATVDLNRRLRQHNGEIVGGAVATKIQVKKGETWERACYIKGMPDWRTALQVEWRWKQLSRKLPRNKLPLERRLIALSQLLLLERPTTKSVLYTEWKQLPEIVFETEHAKSLYSSILNLVS
jgi:structure-specific endonuclease subunit SLX1